MVTKWFVKAMSMEQRKIIIDDTTLRDGEQSAGVAFTSQEKFLIAQELDKIGVPELEIGIPAMGPQECEVIKSICALGLKARTILWGRMRHEDLWTMLGLGADMVDLSIPLSDQQIFHKLGRNREWVLETVFSMVSEARDYGVAVCVGGEDASRADMDFIAAVMEAAEQAGASRFRFADTVGVMEPFEMRKRFQTMRSRSHMELEVHAHDDLGLATANSMAAVLGGATHVNTTVHGLGERAGNAALEEVALSLKVLYGFETGLDLTGLPGVSKLVADASGRPVGVQKSLVGPAVFSHESGIHVDGLLKDTANYQGVDPSLVGRHHHLVLGKHSGTHGVMHAYSEIGIVVGRNQAREILWRIRDFVERTKRTPEAEDLQRFHLETAESEGAA